MLDSGTVVKVHDGTLRAKLKMATPNILAQNVKLVFSMLEAAKPMVAGETPLGPGHFGYHGRDTLRIEVLSTLKKTTGKLLGAVQLFWRERGTMTHGLIPGEKARWTARRAVARTRRFIGFYYGGMANWWRL